MAHKIRIATGDRDSSYQPAHLVEMDNSYFGGSGRGPRGRATESKVRVLVAVESRGKKRGCLVIRVADSLLKDRVMHFAQQR